MLTVKELIAWLAELDPEAKMISPDYLLRKVKDATEFT
jgi:hypothetical protein